MKYKLKEGNPVLSVNLNGTYYRLKTDEYREYPPELVALYQDILEPEHETKHKKKVETPTEEIE
jgi:hypothetical protein